MATEKTAEFEYTYGDNTKMYEKKAVYRNR